jgi:hypothetical protein
LRFVLGALFNGVCWGIGAAWLYLPEAPLESMFVVLTVAGVSAGVSGSQASLLGGLLGFIVPAFCLPALRLLIGVRGKPRRSGRGRIARTANSRPLVGF